MAKAALALDHDTDLLLAGGSAGHARLSHGAIVLELPAKAAARARFDVNDGFVELNSGKISLRAGSDFAILDVVRGSASFSAAGGVPLRVTAGEEARRYRASAPYVSSGAALAEAV